MLQPRVWLLGLFPFRPIIPIGCRPAPAEGGLDRPATRATDRRRARCVVTIAPSLAREVIRPGAAGALPEHPRPVWRTDFAHVIRLSAPDRHGPAKIAHQPDLDFAPRTCVPKT